MPFSKNSLFKSKPRVCHNIALSYQNKTPCSNRVLSKIKTLRNYMLPPPIWPPPIGWPPIGIPPLDFFPFFFIHQTKTATTTTTTNIQVHILLKLKNKLKSEFHDLR